MKTIAEAIGRISMPRLLLCRPADGRFCVDDERQPVLADDADGCPGRDVDPLLDLAVHCSPTTQDDARWREVVLVTPRVPTRDRRSCHRLRTCPRSRRGAAWTIRTTPTTTRRTMTATIAAGDDLVARHVVPRLLRGAEDAPGSTMSVSPSWPTTRTCVRLVRSPFRCRTSPTIPHPRRRRRRPVPAAC